MIADASNPYLAAFLNNNNNYNILVNELDFKGEAVTCDTTNLNLVTSSSTVPQISSFVSGTRYYDGPRTNGVMPFFIY